jgi:hypothetical protein
MKGSGKTIITVAVTIVAIASVYFNIILKKELSILEKEVETLTSQKLSSYLDLEECLKQNEKYLKKELVDKYADSLITLRNKVEEGYVPTDEEIKNFFDRTEFIVDNLELLMLPEKKASQYIYFIESMRDLLKSFSVSDKKSDDEIE